MATNLRIIPSAEEASLHPRAIWNHWRKTIIWDPRSYYGVLEFIGVLVCVITMPQLNGYPARRNSYFWSSVLKLSSGSLLVIPIAALHWYSNHRQSTSILTRSRTHIVVLLIVVVLVFGIQMISLTMMKCVYDCGLGDPVPGFLWLSILVLLGALYVIYQNARNPRNRDPGLAELPSPTTYLDTNTSSSGYGYLGDLDDMDSQRVWAESTMVADGIEDEEVEVEGQVRLL